MCERCISQYRSSSGYGVAGRKFATGVFKMPVKGPVRVETLGIQGDVRADLTAHGGGRKRRCTRTLPNITSIGTISYRPVYNGVCLEETLRLRGLPEESVHTGDCFQVGSAELIVTQPRFPCYKLAMKFDSMEMVKRFQLSGRCGFYLAVLNGGHIATGDQISLITLNSNSPTVAEIFKSDQ